VCIWSHSFSLEINRNSKEFKNNVLNLPDRKWTGVRLRIGCRNEPMIPVKYSITVGEIKTTYFCQSCYRTLERERIIENGKIIKV